MSGPNTVPMGDIPMGFNAQASDRSAQVIQIDNGRAIAVTGICAAICGICLAATIGTIWHSKERETETQARIRVLQNHIDENTALLRVLEKDHATR